MPTLLCYICTAQIRQKAAMLAETEEHEKLFIVACSHTANKLVREIKTHNEYPMFQSPDGRILCFAHWIDPDVNVELFDEWIHEVYT